MANGKSRSLKDKEVHVDIDNCSTILDVYNAVKDNSVGIGHVGKLNDSTIKSLVGGPDIGNYVLLAVHLLFNDAETKIMVAYASSASNMKGRLAMKYLWINGNQANNLSQSEWTIFSAMSQPYPHKKQRMASGKARYLPKNILDFGYEIIVNANTSKTFTVKSNWNIAFAVIAQGGSGGSRTIFDIVMGYATSSRCAVWEAFSHSSVVLDTSDASGKSFTIRNNDTMDISFTVIPLSRITITSAQKPVPYNMANGKTLTPRLKFKDIRNTAERVNIDNIHDNIIYSGHYENNITSTIGIPSEIPGGTFDVVVTFISGSWRYQLMMSMYNGNIIRRAYRNGAWTDWALVSTKNVGGGNFKVTSQRSAARWAA